MSEENINGIPEEEENNDLPNEEDVQSTEETAAESTEVTDETAEEETSETDSAENVKEESEEDLCLCCEENKKSEDSDYCSECEAVMLSRKIPFLAWIGGLTAVVFSVFAVALVFLLTAPTVQIAKADKYARNNCWYSAYTAYSEVPAVVNEITTILGGESPFVKTGSGISVKKFNALAHYTSPLEAFYYEGTSIEHLEGKSSPTMKDYYALYDEYMSSYDIVLNTLESKFGQSEPSAEELHAEVEKLRGTEGMSDIWVDYYHYTFALNSNESDDVLLGYLKAIDEHAKKSKLDYSWLYYTEIAGALYKEGDYDGSLEYLDKLIKKDKTNFGAYEHKMRILLKTNGLEDAKKLLDEFAEYNEGIDTYYVLNIMYRRCAKEYDKALELCNEALEQYGSAPELYRQLALIQLLKGDYDNAYESAYNAFNTANYIAQYYQDQSSLTTQLYNTLYLCAYFESQNGSMSTDNASQVSEIINDLKEFVTAESVLSVIDGTKTIEQVLTEGEFDLV